MTATLSPQDAARLAGTLRSQANYYANDGRQRHLVSNLRAGAALIEALCTDLYERQAALDAAHAEIARLKEWAEVLQDEDRRAENVALKAAELARLRAPSISADLLAQAGRALVHMEARKDEDVDEWATKLAADFVAAGEGLRAPAGDAMETAEKLVRAYLTDVGARDDDWSHHETMHTEAIAYEINAALTAAKARGAQAERAEMERLRAEVEISRKLDQRIDDVESEAYLRGRKVGEKHAQAGREWCSAKEAATQAGVRQGIEMAAQVATMAANSLRERYGSEHPAIRWIEAVHTEIVALLPPAPEGGEG